MAHQKAALDENALRNFREFLETYNKISESCFRDCVVNLHERQLTDSETSCVDLCAEKNLLINHKVLQAFIVEQPKVNQKKIEEAQQAALKMAEVQAKEVGN